MLINSENKITDCNDFDHNGMYTHLGGQNLYTKTARRGPHKHLEGSLVYMYFPSLLRLETSFLVYTKPLFCLLRHLRFQSWKHLWFMLFSLRPLVPPSHSPLLSLALCKFRCRRGWKMAPVLATSQVRTTRPWQKKQYSPLISEIPRRRRSWGGRCANLSQIVSQFWAKLPVFRFIHQRKGAQNCR